MKKSIYDASFEESQNLIDEEFIKEVVSKTEPESRNKRLYGVMIFGAVIGLLTLFVEFIENAGESPIKTNILSPIWYGGVSFLLVYYLFLYVKYKNKPIFNFYHFVKVMTFLMILLLTKVHLFFIQIEIVVPGSVYVYIIYSILIILYILNSINSTTSNIRKGLYEGGEDVNKVKLFMDKFVDYAKKYGGLIVLAIVLYRVFFINGVSEFGSIFKLAYTLIWAPIVTLVGTQFLLSMFREEYMPAYYFNKYYSKYEEMYSFARTETNDF